jgi:hypothetical protein
LGLVSWGLLEVDINEKVHSLEIPLCSSLNIRLRAVAIKVNYTVLFKSFSALRLDKMSCGVDQVGVVRARV